MAANPIPEGYHTLTPHIVVRGAGDAIEYYKKALCAGEVCRMPGPDGSLMHAEVRIGDSPLMLVDENPQWGCRGPHSIGGSPVTIHMCVEDVDAVFKKALDAGGKEIMTPMDAFWGDRYGKFEDPFGHVWSVATRKEDLTEDEIKQRAQAMFAQG